MPTTPAPLRQPPLEVADGTFLLRSAHPMAAAPLTVATNSLVMTGDQPVVIDTGRAGDRDQWFEDLASIVDPRSVRWVLLSHDGDDHTGNLRELLRRSPEATVVTCWAATERTLGDLGPPPTRVRWVDDGDRLDLGGRQVIVVRPPVYDSAAARAYLDTATGLLWASDAFSAPMPARPVDRVDQLPPRMWAEGLAMYHHHALAPWLPTIDRAAYGWHVQRLAALDPATVVAAHTPVIAGAAVAAAFAHLASLPDVQPPPHPAAPTTAA